MGKGKKFLGTCFVYTDWQLTVMNTVCTGFNFCALIFAVMCISSGNNTLHYVKHEMKWRYARPNTRVCTHTHTMYTNIYIQTHNTWFRDLRTHFFGTAVCVRVECRTWAWYQPLWALHESCALHNRERVSIIGISLSTNLTWFFALTFQRLIYWFPHAFIYLTCFREKFN